MYGDFRVYHSQSERLMLEQPGVKVQQNLAGMNKVFWQPNYLWWALGTGTMTLFSAAALVTMHYWLIRRRHSSNRENFIPLLTMVVAATTVSTSLLPEV